jgi:sulfur relay (sulfurtransferase) complex TusBCD TusD component (DsrE family)
MGSPRLGHEERAHENIVHRQRSALPPERVFGGHKAPEGFYNVERMLMRVLSAKGRVLPCGTCMDARGLTDNEIMIGARRGTMDELAGTTVEADKVLVF